MYWLRQELEALKRRRGETLSSTEEEEVPLLWGLLESLLLGGIDCEAVLKWEGRDNSSLPEQMLQMDDNGCEMLTQGKAPGVCLGLTRAKQLPWEEVQRKCPWSGVSRSHRLAQGSLTRFRNSGPPAGDRPSGRTERRMVTLGIRAGTYPHTCAHTYE